jgi:hypothetical protein
LVGIRCVEHSVVQIKGSNDDTMSDEMCRYERQPFTYHACSEESTWLRCTCEEEDRNKINITDNKMIHQKRESTTSRREKRETTADDSLGSTPSVWGWLEGGKRKVDDNESSRSPTAQGVGFPILVPHPTCEYNS